MNELNDFINRVKRFLSQDQNIFTSETSVREQIVLPILGLLKWDTTDPHYIRPEFPLQNRRVDYALFANTTAPSCIIEVKAIGKVDADSQLFEYAFHAGAPLAVLTDGREWRVYLPMSPGSYNERLVRTINLGENSEIDTADTLSRYLSFENTCNGKSVEYAKSDRDLKSQRETAKSNIHVAWRNLLKQDSDNRLLQLIVDETSKISGYAPETSDVKEFLINLKHYSEINQKTDTYYKKIKDQRTSSKKHDKVVYWLLEQQYSTKNYTEAYREIMEVLIKRLSNEKINTLKFIFLDKNQIPQSAQSSKIRLLNGMWIHTNKNTNAKLQELKLTCQAANIQFGRNSGLNINRTK